MPKQPIPETGPLIVDAFGETPSLTFNKPGQASITLGDILLTLTPRDENGAETGLGTFESLCTLNDPTKNLLHTFTITDGSTGGSSTGGTTDGGTTTGGTTDGGTTTGGTTDGGTTTGGTTGGSTDGGTTTGGTTGGGGSDPIKLAYDALGVTMIKANGGSAKISGDIHVDFDLAAKTYEGDLRLDPTTENFQVMGMPGEADIKFVQTRRTKGTYDGNKLTSNSEMYVYLTEVRMGGYPFGGGANCRTVTPVLVNMQGENFDPFKGGKLAGVYELPKFENCGQNTNMINQYASGPGNTIDLTLTKKDSGGTDTGGTTDGGTTTGGTTDGGTTTGGSDTGSSYGGYDMGGFGGDSGSYGGDSGGYDMGGFGMDSGGYDMGGFGGDSGSYGGDSGGYDMGGFGGDSGGYDMGGWGMDSGGYGGDSGSYGGDSGGYSMGGWGGW